jgi:hypothetical protein
VVSIPSTGKLAGVHWTLTRTRVHKGTSRSSCGSGCERHDCALNDQMGRVDSREVENGWRVAMLQRTIKPISMYTER